MPDHTHHIAICIGPRCTPCGEAAHLATRIPDLLAEEFGDATNEISVKQSEAHCFGICRDGPVVVVRPNTTWYCRVDETKLRRIIQEHIRQGTPVLEYTFDKQ